METESQRAHELIALASRALVITGAGISTDSGIPDYRGPEGTWTLNPDAEMKSTLDTWVNDEAFRREAWRRRVESHNERPAPNQGHDALVRWAQSGTLDTLVTQNIDGLHSASGFPSARLIEIHGCLRDCVCLSCGWRAPIEIPLEWVRSGDGDPHCRQSINAIACGGLLKSATISFGQSLRHDDLQRAQAAAQQCDLLVAIGSTLSVFPVAGIVPLAAQHAPIVIINGGPTAMDELATVIVRDDITTTLTTLWPQ
jgi:NAD-dependent deacetylase